MFQDSSIHSWLLAYQTTTYSPLYPHNMLSLKPSIYLILVHNDSYMMVGYDSSIFQVC